MPDVVYSHAGVTVEVSVDAQNDDLTEPDFDALSYVQVRNVGMVGEYGISTNILSYDTLDTNVSKKSKGITNAGDPPLEVARTDSDPGQIAMRVMGAPDYFDAHAFRITKQDNAIDYMRGLVSGPVSGGGRNEDFDIHVFTLGLVQRPEHVIGGDWIYASGFLDLGGIITSLDTIPST